MSIQSKNRPFWVCSCFKKRLLRAVLPLTLVLAVVLVVGLSASTAIAANGVAMENLRHAFTPTLVKPPSVNGVALHADHLDESVAQQNIARTFDPGWLRAGSNDVVGGQTVSNPESADVTVTGGDVAQQNIDSIFKNASAY